MYYIFISSPFPGIEPGVRCHGIKANPAGYIWSKPLWMLSDKWLSRYGLVENWGNTTFWRCTRFWRLAPSPGMDHGVRIHQWKSILQGIYVKVRLLRWFSKYEPREKLDTENVTRFCTVAYGWRLSNIPSGYFYEKKKEKEKRREKGSN